ncbi:MAG: Rrf2 family transcriptional regulator [Planctomycetota bacterium]
MRLSKKGVYALRVLRLLAEDFGRNPISATTLAEQEGISVKYLEQVLAILRKRGILVSERGKTGGYSLRVPPDKITLGDIIRATDGPLAPIPCASRTAPHEDPDCPYPFDTCWLRHLMRRVRDNISAILDQETLAQMTLDAKGAVRKQEFTARRNSKGKHKE